MLRACEDYLREPRRGFFSEVCRVFAFFRVGFEIRKVPLPNVFRFKQLFFAKTFLL